MQMKIVRDVRKVESEKIEVTVPKEFLNREVEILIIPTGPPQPVGPGEGKKPERELEKEPFSLPEVTVTPHEPKTPPPPVEESAKPKDQLLPRKPGDEVPLEIPGLGTVNVAMEKDGLLAIRGATRYYVKGVGNIDLKIVGDVFNKIYFEGVKGDVYVRISSRGDVLLKYRDAKLEVKNDFGVGIFAGKVMAKAGTGASGAVKINNVEVGMGGGGSINAEVAEDGSIKLGGSINTEIHLGEHKLRFKANSHVNLHENGAVRELRNMMVKLHDGTYKKINGTLKKLAESGHHMFESAKKGINNVLHPHDHKEA